MSEQFNFENKIKKSVFFFAANQHKQKLKILFFPTQSILTIIFITILRFILVYISFIIKKDSFVFSLAYKRHDPIHRSVEDLMNENRI